MSPVVRTYVARWVFPVAGPPIPNGMVTVRGSGVEVIGPRVGMPDVDFGNAAIIPGLVNAHTHLDLSGARGRIPPTNPDHFTDWLRGVIAYRRSRTAKQVQADIRTGLAECLRSGTTLLGDISSDGESWAAVAESPVRAVVFRELIGLSDERFQRAASDILRWMSGVRPGTAACLPGVSPHAPYSCRAELLPVLTETLRAMGVRMAVHLAETPAELELLRRQSGPFVWFLAELGAWDPTGLAWGPEQFLELTHNATQVVFAHCNYLAPDAVFTAGQSIAYCPRTHAAFGHPPHPFREFRTRGVRVCLGTDSLASNPDLDILAEARFVHHHYPDFPGDELLRMVTLDGAEALGFADETGSLEPGKSADFVAVPLPNRDATDPHELLFADHPGDRQTVFRGEPRN